jgi:hypothetical protein
MSYKTAGGPAAAIGRNIDGKTIADTTLVKGVSEFIPSKIHFVCKTVTGFVSAPTVSVGTNSPNFNNIVTAAALTGLSTIDLVLPGILAGLPVIVRINDTIKARVSIVGVATTLTFDVFVEGIDP